jgi:predicted TIM-barrel fold metal-dependent hydrolase
MALPDYRFFDADNHYYETRDAFTRHIEPRFRDKAVHVRRAADGSEEIWTGNRRFTFLNEYTYDRVGRPGALRLLLKKHEIPDYQNQAMQPVAPEFTQRAARLARMDAQNVESMWLFPTLAVCVEHYLRRDPEAVIANFRAFNRWLLDDWGFGRDGRIYAAPVLSLCDRDAAARELEWALAEGARLVCLLPGPAYGRSPADPHFDRFWSIANEAGIAIAFHVGESGYNELWSTHWGEQPTPSSHEQSAFQWTSCYGDRPIMDTLSNLIFANLFGRYPRLRVASVENGSIWVSYLLKAMDKMGGMGRRGPWIGGRIREKPSAIFRRHVFVSPYYEEDLAELARAIGVSQILFGSDYPHPEGLAEPAQYLEELASFGPDDVRRIMRENALALVAPPS